MAIFKKEDDQQEKTAEKPPLAVPVEKDTSPLALRELLEKNLKWSQIIYEQNRKIKNALVWKAIASWMWFIVLVVLPTIGSYWIWVNRDSFMKKFSSTISTVVEQTLVPALMPSLNTNPTSATGSQEVNSSQVEELMKVLPLNDVQKEQLKAMLDKK